MFAISNKIAYAGQMVQVVGPRKLDVEAVLGASTWIDLEEKPIRTGARQKGKL
jgi:hypothetical protein